jgi:deoxyribose-phosphate aldolase
MSNSPREIKIIEASAAAQAGGKAIDMIINIGKTLSGDWKLRDGRNLADQRGGRLAPRDP